MNKKLIALLTALALCFSLLTACGTGGEANGQAAGTSSAASSAPAAQSAAESPDASAAADLSAAPEAENDAVEAETLSAVDDDLQNASADKQAKTPAFQIDPSAPEVKVGMLTILNLSEEDAANMVIARRLATTQLVKEGSFSQNSDLPEENGPVTVTYYDNLDTMLMALKSGQINTISITDSVADYLLYTNRDLDKPMSHNPEVKDSTFASMMEQGLVGEGYSFMMMKDHEKLCKEFDKALSDMKKDGTLDRLIKEQITDVVTKGKEPEMIELQPIANAETICVAVTGALPPMDYVSPIGMPVGFSTAVLAEISSRIHKNISISVIDSGARASALASGKADVVFWTRTSTASSEVKAMTEKERYALSEGLTSEQVSVIEQINSVYDFTIIADMDTPEGTIVTQPYYAGFNFPVLLVQK